MILVVMVIILMLIVSFALFIVKKHASIANVGILCTHTNTSLTHWISCDGKQQELYI